MRCINRIMILLSGLALFLTLPCSSAAAAEQTADAGNAETQNTDAEMEPVVYGLCFGLNVHDLDSFWSQAYQWGAQPGLNISESWMISVPAQCMIHGEKDVWMIDTGCRVIYYPGFDSWWLGTTLLQNLLLYGEDAPDDDHYTMNELLIGKTIALGGRWTLDPYLLLRNPFGKHTETLASIQEVFPSFGQLEIGIGIGAELFSQNQ